SLNGIKYNIDIDFDTYLFPSTIEEENKLIVSSSKSIYQLFVIDTLNSLSKKPSNIFYCPISYMSGVCGVDLGDPSISQDLKKTLLLASLRPSLKRAQYRPDLPK